MGLVWIKVQPLCVYWCITWVEIFFIILHDWSQPLFVIGGVFLFWNLRIPFDLLIYISCVYTCEELDRNGFCSASKVSWVLVD